MTDIVERLMSAVSLGAGRSSDERAMMNEAADEIVRLRGELANVQRDRMAQAENERLRGLITEVTETWNPTPESKSQTRDLEVTDIVERLTHFGKGTKHTDPFPITQWRTILNEAADEIVRLLGENAALKAELDRITPVLNYLLDGN